mgnify:CR=1 FL=1
MVIPVGEKEQFMMRFTKTGENSFNKEIIVNLEILKATKKLN